MILRILVLAPTLALLLANLGDAFLLATGLLLAVAGIEWALGWNRR